MASIPVADPAALVSSPRLTGEARLWARTVALEVEHRTGRSEALSLAVELMVLHCKRLTGGDAGALAELLLEAARTEAAAAGRED